MRYFKIFYVLICVIILPIGEVWAEEKKTHYPSGSIHFIRTYSVNKLNGPSKEFYDDERSELKRDLFYNKGKLESEKHYRTDGQIEYEMQMKGGKKHEIQHTFHPSGKLFRERQLINSLQEGMERDYYPDSKIKAARMYKNGKKEGSAKGYFKTGRVQGDWVFSNGVPVAATIYYSTGEKHLVHEFKDGKIHGITKEFNKKGQLRAKRFYEDDKLKKRVRQ